MKDLWILIGFLFFGLSPIVWGQTEAERELVAGVQEAQRQGEVKKLVHFLHPDSLSHFRALAEGLYQELAKTLEEPQDRYEVTGFNFFPNEEVASDREFLLLALDWLKQEELVKEKEGELVASGVTDRGDVCLILRYKNEKFGVKSGVKRVWSARYQEGVPKLSSVCYFEELTTSWIRKTKELKVAEGESGLEDE